MKIVKKPWGSEEIISYNKIYVVKKLFMKKGHRCSLQFHRLKHETVFLITGMLKVYFGSNKYKLKKKVLKKNQSIILKPKTIHRMEALKDSIYLESSTPHLDDVVRLEDDYRRI